MALAADLALIIVISCFIIHCSSAASNFNITELLEPYPEYATFSDALTWTHVAEEVNQWKSVTFLALSNSAMLDIVQTPEETLANIMRLHIVLDYYDIMKITSLGEKQTYLTTLFHKSGAASDQQGFLKVAKDEQQNVLFGSAVPGAPMDSRLRKAVASVPFNISILEVSGPIMAPWLNGGAPIMHLAAPPKGGDADAFVFSGAPVNAPAHSPLPEEEIAADEIDDHPPPPSSCSRTALVSGGVMLVSLIAVL